MSELWLPPSFDRQSVQGALSAFGRREGEDPVVAEMRANRAVNRRRAAAIERQASYGGGDLSLATVRPRDPMFYWKQNNLPFDFKKPEELRKLRTYCQMLYLTHPVIGSAIDIYSKFPLTGMELQCEDSKITEFYTDLFFDQLNYEDFLVDVGRQYWTVGEAWPLGSFNELLGVWEDDELINPDDVEVIRSPFSKEPRFMMKLPEEIRTVLSTRQPAWEYDALIRAYPELAAFASYTDKALMPVSSILLRQVQYRSDVFNPRGIPLLTRGLRAVMQEEMLNAAQDAIADRLYTPLILVKLGASASDLGTQVPWIPTPGDLAAFEDALDAALAGDFRVLTHHFAVEMTSVFGKENMPNFDADFERLTERQLQVFGLSKTMLSGAGRGETYAADALNRDLVSQLLTTYQRVIKRHYRDRALVVAEAQGHYEREYKGGVPYPVLEEVLVVDEETGEQRIEERPKLLIPELNIRAMNMSDEKEERQLVEALRASGVPISMRRRLVNIPIDLEEEEKAIAEEQIRQVVAAQEVRRDTYLALRSKGLPIPQDLRDDFEPRAIMPGGPDAPAADQQPLPGMGLVEPADTAALAPTPADNDLAIQNGGGSQPGGQPQATPPMAQVVPFRPRNINGVPRRPPESDEQRDGMPKASSLQQPSDALPGLAGPRFRKVTMRADRPLDDQLEDLRRSAPLRADGA